MREKITTLFLCLVLIFTHAVPMTVYANTEEEAPQETETVVEETQEEETIEDTFVVEDSEEFSTEVEEVSEPSSEEVVNEPVVTPQDDPAPREDWLHWHIDLVWDIAEESKKYYQNVVVNGILETIGPKYKLTVQTSSVDYEVGEMEIRIPASLFLRRYDEPGYSPTIKKIYPKEISVPSDPYNTENTYFYYEIDYDTDELIFRNNQKVMAGSNQIIEVRYEFTPDEVYDLSERTFKATGKATPVGYTEVEERETPEITYRVDTGFSSIYEQSNMRKFEQVTIKDGYRYYRVQFQTSVDGNQAYYKYHTFDFMGTDGEVVGPEENFENGTTMTLEEAAAYYTYRSIPFFDPEGPINSHETEDYLVTMYVRYPDKGITEQDKLRVGVRVLGADDDSHTPPEDYNDHLSHSMSFYHTWVVYPDKPIGDWYKNPLGQSRNRAEIFAARAHGVYYDDRGAAYFAIGVGNDGMTIGQEGDNNTFIITDTGLVPDGEAPEFDYEISWLTIPVGDMARNRVFVYDEAGQTIRPYTGSDYDWYDEIIIEGLNENGWQTVWRGNEFGPDYGGYYQYVWDRGSSHLWFEKGYYNFRVTFTGVKENIILKGDIVQFNLRSRDYTKEFVERTELDTYTNWASFEILRSDGSKAYEGRDWGKLTLTPFYTNGTSAITKSVQNASSDSATRKVTVRFRIESTYSYGLTNYQPAGSANSFSGKALTKLIELVPEYFEDQPHLNEFGDLVTYDLLPLGYSFKQFIRSSIGADINNRYEINNPSYVYTQPLPTVQIIDDYKGTGRQMVIMTQKCGSDIESYVRNGTSISRLENTLTYEAEINWEDLVVYQNERNLVAQKHTGDTPLINGFPDDGAPNSMSVNLLAFQEVLGDDGNYAFYDVDGNGDVDTPNTLYSSVTVSPNVATSATSGISKKVMGNSNTWQDIDKTETNTIYKYRIRVVSSERNRLTDLIIYDTLEDGANTELHSGEVTWKGTFHSVDTSFLEHKGYAPVVYYSTAPVEDLDYNLVTGQDNNPWIDDTTIWSTELPDDLSKVTAIAVDCRKRINGLDAVMDPRTGVEFVIRMTAPSEYPTLTDPNMVYAINRPAYFCQIYAQDSAEGNYFTDIGHRVMISMEPRGKLKITKNSVNQDTPYNTTFTITGPNGYRHSFQYRDMVNNEYELEDLDLGEYTIEERLSDYDNAWSVSVEGAENPSTIRDRYTLVTTANVNVDWDTLDHDVIITNTSNRKDIKGRKLWHEREDVSNAKYTMKSDYYGEYISSRNPFFIMLYANGVYQAYRHFYDLDSEEWGLYNLPIFDENNEEIVYTVEEWGQLNDDELDYLYKDDYTYLDFQVHKSILKGEKPVNLKLYNREYDPEIGGYVYRYVETKTVTKEDFGDGDTLIAFNDLPLEVDGQYRNYYIFIDMEDLYYQSSVDGYTLTNTRLMDVSVEKKWQTTNPEDYQDITLVLNKTVNGQTDVVEEVTLPKTTPSDGWKYTWMGLPEYEGEYPVTYTVTEKEGSGYKLVSVEGNDLDGFVITNKVTVDVQGQKTWDDKDNQDGKRPESITVRLLANGEEVDSKVVTEEDDWAYSFTGLDKYGQYLRVIHYTIEEDPVDGYTTEVDGYNITNTHTPEKTSITVNKKWEDKDNQDGIRPESITVRLFANGEEVKSQVISSNEDWSYTFEGLDKYKDGELIEYTIEEEPVEGYEASIDGYTITNTHTPEVVSIEGEKIWEDENDQDGIRPDKITVHILGNGKKVKTITVKKEDDWKFVVEGLDKYENGEIIEYTIEEEKVEGYTTEIDGYTITNTHTPKEPPVPDTSVKNHLNFYGVMALVSYGAWFYLVLKKRKA